MSDCGLVSGMEIGTICGSQFFGRKPAFCFLVVSDENTSLVKNIEAPTPTPGGGRWGLILDRDLHSYEMLLADVMPHAMGAAEDAGRRTVGG